MTPKDDGEKKLFFELQIPALVGDAQAGKGQGEQRARGSTQEGQPDGEPAGDEQPADQPGQDEHRPVLEPVGQDESNHPAGGQKEPSQQTGLWCEKFQECQRDGCAGKHAKDQDDDVDDALGEGDREEPDHAQEQGDDDEREWV